MNFPCPALGCRWRFFFWNPCILSYGVPMNAVPPTLEWIGDATGHLRLLDQTRLPAEVVLLDCRRAEEVFEAIGRLSVRGAPAIGMAAAYGLVLGLKPHRGEPPQRFRRQAQQVARLLASSRPTAVNLAWALDRLLKLLDRLPEDLPSEQLHLRLWQEATAIQQEDEQMCRQMAEHGASLLTDGMGVLTHCNTGALAASRYGTALGCIFRAFEQGKRLRVYADETRPLLQGARLTTWELRQRGIPVTLLCDSAAAWLMRSGQVQAVLVGADRIAANGDTANKIGTYAVALAAREHGVPFYVVAPGSTFDLSLPGGEHIPIEQRAAEEVTRFGSVPVAPEGVEVFNPAFDVTPAEWITAIVCQRGIIRPVTRGRIAEMLGEQTEAVE